MKAKDAAGVLSSMVIAFAVLFAVGEVAVRLYTHFALIYDVEMTRYSNELKMDSDDPRIGHVHRPGARSRLMGVDVQINSDGLRDREYPVERTAARRIAVLGDSLTFGWGVEKRDTFEERLERALDAVRPTELINFGTGNYNTEQETRLFLSKGLKYRPDEVVVFYFINDAEPTPRRSRLAFLGRSRMVTFFWSRVLAAASRFSRSQSFAEYYSSLYREGSPGWEATQAAFIELHDVCAQRDMMLKVVLLPELHQLSPYRFAAEHRLVSNFLGGLGIPVLDLAPRFAGVDDPHSLWVALDDAHPNALAHEMIAEYARDFVEQEQP